MGITSDITNVPPPGVDGEHQDPLPPYDDGLQEGLMVPPDQQQTGRSPQITLAGSQAPSDTSAVIASPRRRSGAKLFHAPPPLHPPEPFPGPSHANANMHPLEQATIVAPLAPQAYQEYRSHPSSQTYAVQRGASSAPHGRPPPIPAAPPRGDPFTQRRDDFSPGRDHKESTLSVPGSSLDKGLRFVQKLNPLGGRAGGSSRGSHGDGIEDVYVAVMGVTGAGKSSFVQMCTGKFVKIGHNLKSCTAFVEDFQVMYNDRIRVHIIDTPGFDDTHKSDTDVLRDIAAWLGTTYTQGILLSGIIYLHRISDPRMTGGAMRNLHMFKELCGKDCFKSLILATTFWGCIDHEQAMKNEHQLKTTEEFWGEMLAHGSHYARHTGDRASAWSILDYMVRQRREFRTTIQREMVDKRMGLNETGAGRQLNADLIALEEQHIKQMRELEDSYKAAQVEQNEKSMKKIAELHNQLQAEIDEGKEAQADLVSSLEKINKERTEELQKYQSDIEKRMQEMAELRKTLDKFQDGSRDSEQREAQYQQQIKELYESLETVKRRQPGIMEQFGRWVEEKVDAIKAWWDEL